MQQFFKPILSIARKYDALGTVAGIIATLPMTMFMLLMQRILPEWQQFALPPERITTELATRANVAQQMDKPQRIGTALVSHFGYGGNMGALYVPFARKVALPPAAKGAIFGLLVWAGNYLGLLPALKISEAAPQQPLRRNVLMVAAHLIWGTTLGITEDVLERSA